MREILDELEARRARAYAGGGEKRVASQRAKGKLLARERLDALLDEGSFEEWDMYVQSPDGGDRCRDSSRFLRNYRIHK